MAQDAKVSVPYPLLPDILAFGAIQPSRREAVIAAIGNRGRWLASLNSDWNYAIQIPASDEEIWQTGADFDRLAALKRIRQEGKTEAFDLVLKGFPQEPADFRTRIVEIISQTVRPEDETFLQTLLTDRSQEVRKTAVRALVKLDGPFAKEVESQLLSLFKYTKSFLKKTLEVEPPPINEAPKKDPKGALETLAFAWPKPYHGVGWRESLLIRMIGLVRPSQLTRHLGISPEDLINIANKHLYGQAIFQGLSKAAILFEDSAWAEALILDSRLPIFIPRLFKALPPRDQERLLAKLLREGKTGMHEIMSLRQWSPELSHEFLKWCKSALTRGQMHFEPLAIAIRLHPSTYDAALNLIDEESEKRIGSWNETLPLLNDMRQTIRNNP